MYLFTIKLRENTESNDKHNAYYAFLIRNAYALLISNNYIHSTNILWLRYWLF